MTLASQSATQVGVRLAVIGAGAWGTVLAALLARNGHNVTLYTRRREQAEAMVRDQENQAYLPGFILPPGLNLSADLNEAAAGTEAAVIAVPSKGLRDLLESLPTMPAVISATKGVEPGTFKRMSQVIGEYQPQALLAALSGPNLAKEIADGKPAASVVACLDDTFAARAQTWFKQETFRVYRSRDLAGAELAGALKNVLALATGMSDALELGENARASLITRGLSEIARLGVQQGGNIKTFYGLAGLGDVVATCASKQSRNHQAGERLVKGETLADLEASGLTAEGIVTVRAVHEYAQAKGLELPVTREVYRVIYEAKPPAKALRALMTRSPGEE